MKQTKIVNKLLKTSSGKIEIQDDNHWQPISRCLRFNGTEGEEQTQADIQPMEIFCRLFFLSDKKLSVLVNLRSIGQYLSAIFHVGNHIPVHG